VKQTIKEALTVLDKTHTSTNPPRSTQGNVNVRTHANRHALKNAMINAVITAQKHIVRDPSGDPTAASTFN
jgi:hypothetical protein